MQKPLYAKSFITGEEHLSCIDKCFPEIDFLDNAVVVFAGFINQRLISLDEEVILKFRNDLLEAGNKDTKYYFDCILEGVVLPIIHTIYKIIGDEIDHKNVYYFTGALNAKNLYTEYKEMYQIDKPIHVMSSPAWEFIASMNDTLPIEYSISPKEKLFLSYNRTVRAHRLALLGLLEEKGLREKSYYSYLNSSNHPNIIEETLQQLSHTLSPETHMTILTNIRRISNLIPLKLNTEPDNNSTMLLDTDIPYITNSQFSLVTETVFFPMFQGKASHIEKPVFFSEKIYKPIMTKHPFIIVSGPGFLRCLRGFGYRTFGDIIDESYDDILDDEARLLAIVDAVEKLSKNTPEQWEEWQRLAKPIVDFNYKVFNIRKKNKWSWK